MKWVLIVLGVLLALALAIIAIGYTLPLAHTARSSVVLRAAPADVWAAITDISAYPDWRDDVDAVELLEPVNGLPAWREKGSNGDITYAMTRAEPPMRMGTRITDENLPFGGGWDFEITPEGAGSRVSITEHGEVYNPLFRFVSRFVMGHTTTIDAYLRALGSKFGETVAPETSATG